MLLAAPLLMTCTAAVPVTPSSSGVRDLESIMLPGIEPGSRKARQSSSKMPLIAAAIVLLLVVAGVSVWMMSGRKSGEIAQSDSATREQANSKRSFAGCVTM